MRRQRAKVNPVTSAWWDDQRGERDREGDDVRGEGAGGVSGVLSKKRIRCNTVGPTGTLEDLG